MSLFLLLLFPCLTFFCFNYFLQTLWLWMLMVLLFCQSVRGIFGKTQFCEVETGQTNIILDIEESRGSCKYTYHFRM